MPDPIFADPRLAAIYDALDDDRSDLDAYLGFADEIGASSVLDIGCGTGTFACMLAERGKEVIGLDPAAASLAVARSKPGSDVIRWIEGDVASLPALQVDLVVMTGNVAQVFLGDADWRAVLDASHRSIRPGGALVFEVRDPAQRAWDTWNRASSERTVDIAGVGSVRTWVELVDVSLPYVSFRHTYEFETDGSVLTSESTLRFREQDEIVGALTRADFEVREVRDALDRPGLEIVFVCQRPLAA